MSNVGVIKFIDQHVDGVFYPVSFQPESAKYECKRSKSNQGYLNKYTVSFRMVGLSASNEAELSRLSRCESLRLRDVNGAEITIGNQAVRLIVTWEDAIGGKSGSFRGTEVQIEWTTSLRVRIKSFT